MLFYLRQYLAAVKDCPKGVLCGWCGKPNFFYDDCGFFCIAPVTDEDNRVCCRKCWRGPLGEVHIGRYGLGER